MKIGDRRFLVFSSADGGRSAYRQWISDDDQRDFDLALYVYNGSIADDRVELIRDQRGYKFPNFFDLSERYDISSYDAVWIVDDDIELSTADINRLFTIFSDQQLLLAQPAYSADSLTPWDLLYHDPLYRLRYSNFVENGVAMFSAAALAACTASMQDLNTGYGAEFLFMHLLRPNADQVAIIDEVVCRHPAAESSLDQRVPRKQHQRDAEQLMKQYGFGYFTPKVIGGIRRQSSP